MTGIVSAFIVAPPRDSLSDHCVTVISPPGVRVKGPRARPLKIGDVIDARDRIVVTRCALPSAGIAISVKIV